MSNKKGSAAADEPEQCWLDFARKHKAQSGFERVESRYSFNGNKWVIKNDSEFEIAFNWNVLRPLRNRSDVKISTDFIFPFSTGENIKFKIYKKDFLTRIFLLFASDKIEMGNSELDAKYIFISDRPEILKTIEPDLQKFETGYRGEYFMIQVEGAEIGIKGNRLLIQVNELLKEYGIIETFFNLGISLRDKINKEP